MPLHTHAHAHTRKLTPDSLHFPVFTEEQTLAQKSEVYQ